MKNRLIWEQAMDHLERWSPTYGEHIPYDSSESDSDSDSTPINTINNQDISEPEQNNIEVQVNTPDKINHQWTPGPSNQEMAELTSRWNQILSRN